MKIGDNIKKIRKSKKMTQSQLAEKLGVTVGMISQYENNTNPPKITTLERIADALEVHVFELYSENPKIAQDMYDEAEWESLESAYPEDLMLSCFAASYETDNVKMVLLEDKSRGDRDIIIKINGIEEYAFTIGEFYNLSGELLDYFNFKVARYLKK